MCEYAGPRCILAMEAHCHSASANVVHRPKNEPRTFSARCCMPPLELQHLVEQQRVGREIHKGEILQEGLDAEGEEHPPTHRVAHLLRYGNWCGRNLHHLKRRLLHEVIAG